jgi:gluconokinase
LFCLQGLKSGIKVALSRVPGNCEYASCRCKDISPARRPEPLKSIKAGLDIAGSLARRCPVVSPQEIVMASALSALVVMGVSGCGKSSVGAAIVACSGGRLIEGDVFHPAANIEKMSAGIPLDDNDRAGWLKRLGEEMHDCLEQGERPVLTCSALKASYRESLRAAVPQLGFVFLELSREAAAERVAHRPGHFMPASLIDSQFATLQSPTGEDRTLTLDATAPVEELARQVKQWLEHHGASTLA